MAKAGAWHAVALLSVGIAGARQAPEPSIAKAPGLRIEVNLPAFRVDVLDGGERVASYLACVGAAGFPTPVGEYEIARVAWSPWWHPPASPWAAGKTAVPPGPTNPMGRAKLEFRPLYYLHGTADTASLGCAASHGCVRLSNEDVVALARRVHRFGRPETSAEELDRLAADPERTRTFELERPVPLAIVYRVAEVEGDELLLHADIYGRLDGSPSALEEEIVRALERAGYATGEIDLSGVRASAGRLPVRGEPPLRVPLDVLVTGVLGAPPAVGYSPPWPGSTRSPRTRRPDAWPGSTRDSSSPGAASTTSSRSTA
jgi:hypothetical protein